MPTSNKPTALKESPLWHHVKGLSQTASGYGKRLATRYMVQFADSCRWHRVYCCIFSNSGMLYAVKNGKDIILDDCILDELRERYR